MGIRPRTSPAPADVAAHYDELDWLYREVWGEHVHHGLWRRGDESPEAAARELVWDVARRAGIAPGDQVCDLGCGYGATARLLAGELGARVTGVTVSPAQHAYAEAEAGAGASAPTFLLRDWCDNGLPADHFDAVVAIESTEHIADKPRCMAEVRRVLRPGGRFVLCAWLAAGEPRDWERHALLRPICDEGRLPGLDTRRDHEGWIAGAGLRLVGYEELTARVKQTWTVCITRAARRLATDTRVRAWLCDPAMRQRVFALTLVRIWLAYETGAMRYGAFTAIR